jgi:hypothetical protein
MADQSMNLAKGAITRWLFEGFRGYRKENRRNEGGVKLPKRLLSPSF